VHGIQDEVMVYLFPEPEARAFCTHNILPRWFPSHVQPLKSKRNIQHLGYHNETNITKNNENIFKTNCISAPVIVECKQKSIYVMWFIYYKLPTAPAAIACACIHSPKLCFLGIWQTLKIAHFWDNLAPSNNPPSRFI
jgi:hypothetical protein